MTQTRDLIKKMADFFTSEDFYEKGEDARLELSPDDVRCMNWANENGYSDELTIERKDCNGNYEPSNCCWITQFEQHGNTRRNKFIEHNNEKHTVAEWARIKNMHPQTIWSRIRLGWNIDDAIEKPIMSKGEKNKC